MPQNACKGLRENIMNFACHTVALIQEKGFFGAFAIANVVDGRNLHHTFTISCYFGADFGWKGRTILVETDNFVKRFMMSLWILGNECLVV